MMLVLTQAKCNELLVVLPQSVYFMLLVFVQTLLIFFLNKNMFQGRTQKC